MKLKTLTVSQINDYISSFISANPVFSNVRVTGEVFNFKKTAYGYTFLSLKDDMSKISAITYLENFDVKVGDIITVQGKISIYKKNGTYSLQILSYEKSGKGQEYENFKLLYEKLEKQGYFAKEIKKQIVKYPQNIGIVTSATGAAVQDIMAVIKRRYPKVNLYIFDSKMQGQDVANRVISGIKALENIEVDTIIISRGGGDSDDLSAFNSEDIARAVYECKVPIISAIGHEIDFVICDFVADLRASTPSMAGELSVPNIRDIYNEINFYESKITSLYKNIVIKNKNILSGITYIIKSNSPYKKIVEKKNYINKLKNDIEVRYEKMLDFNINSIEKLNLEINNKYEKKLQSSKNKLNILVSKIEENNYVKIMSKGFALIEKNDKLIKLSNSLKENDEIKIKMVDGTVSAVVKGD